MVESCKVVLAYKSVNRVTHRVYSSTFGFSLSDFGQTTLVEKEVAVNVSVLIFFYNQGEFVDDGTETHFQWGSHNCYIKAISSGKKKDGIIHSLVIDGNEIPESIDE